MENDKITLTMTDMEAIGYGDSNYINNKGAKLYAPETYGKSVEYYRLAATMGNVQAISNLGYCYLYGRSIEKNISLAIAYFKVAAMRDNVDAAYKLGDIYGSDKWGVKDKELSVYYYRMAASYVIGENWEKNNAIIWSDDLQRYPSLCYALARELSRDGYMATDLDAAYQFLKHAKSGYEKFINDGSTMYQQSYEGVIDLLDDSQFDKIRENYDRIFDDEYDYGDEED